MKYDHDIIRDLMPLCIDDIATEKSKEAVSEHIAECEECRKEWEQMNNISVHEKVTVSEETAKYTETAKRVRKHNRWVLLKLTCAILLALFIGGIVGNYADGARFTPKGIAKQYIEDWCDLSDVDIEYLGTVKSKDGKCEATLAAVRNRETGAVNLCESTADRSDLLRMGMWSGTGGAWTYIPEDIGIFMDGTTLSYDNGMSSFSMMAFYTADKNVKHISFVLGGESYELEPDEKGFCCLRYETDSNDIRDRSIYEGTATDANGRVLYTVQEISGTSDSGYEYTIHDWVKAE